MKFPWSSTEPYRWLRHVLAIHFDPDEGTPYWLERERELGFSVRQHVSTFSDVARLGPMDEEALATRPLEDFIPRRFARLSRAHWVLGETAGTTGVPKVTVFSAEEFEGGFVEPFGIAAEIRGFPKRLPWLWAGPSGPHIIGKSARACAARLGSCDPFAVDFDPRWVKKFPPGSTGQLRYLRHIEDQAMVIIEQQRIGVIFTTPPVLARLGRSMTKAQREAIRGVHYGGMAISPEELGCFKENLFPRAVHLAGYGNSLCGVCFEVGPPNGYDLDYFSPGPRLVVSVVEPATSKASPEERLARPVAYGERGQVVLHRLDETVLLLNIMERDEAGRIPASPSAHTLGLTLDGLRNPAPPPVGGPALVQGVY